MFQADFSDDELPRVWTSIFFCRCLPRALIILSCNFWNTKGWNFSTNTGLPPCWFISRLLFKSGDFGGDFIRFFPRKTSVVPLFRVHALDLGDKSQGVIPSDHWTSRLLPAFNFSQSWVFHRTSCTRPCDGVSQFRKSSKRNYRFHRIFR